ncbi:MAG TPA: hypothetical protein VML75_05475 [Kofleriaceae bacterium]|nr:hypothetical protein [Kofleriaceae bacterium]
MTRLVLLATLGLSLATACGNGGGSPDAQQADAREPADAAIDAAPDAFVRCPGGVLFTGEYLDWDSSDAVFQGIFEATITDSSTNATAQTAPNGRWELCVPAATTVVATITHPDRVPVRYVAAPEVIAAGMVSTRGLTIQQYLDLHSDAGINVVGNTAVVLIEVRSHPSLQPVEGATIEIGGVDPEHRFSVDAAWELQTGTATGASGYMFFANVTLGAGINVATVTPPVGTTCVGPAQFPVAAGEISAVSFACD